MSRYDISEWAAYCNEAKTGVKVTAQPLACIKESNDVPTLCPNIRLVCVSARPEGYKVWNSYLFQFFSIGLKQKLHTQNSKIIFLLACQTHC